MILKEEGKTEAEVATKLGVARNTISNWLGQNIDDVGADKADNPPNLDALTKFPSRLKSAKRTKPA